MKAIATLFILLLTMFGTKLVYANTIVKTIEACESQNLPMKELSSCLDVVQSHSEKILETWINNQTFMLEDFAKSTGRFSALNMFKRSQKSFITFRENNCRWQYLINTPGLAAAPAYKKCNIILNNNRINELSQFRIE